MIEIQKKGFILVITLGTVVFGASLIMGFYFSEILDDPEYCSSCHEMIPFYDTYIFPYNGSLISDHNLTCLQCHTNRSRFETKKKLATEIFFKKLNLETVFRPHLDLAPDCLSCHTQLNSPMHDSFLNCTDCHLAHYPPTMSQSNISTISTIRFGPHVNQTCQNCHGSMIQIPECIKCHTGHGEQKLENKLCLACHIDPHIPKKPGILNNNTIKFTGNLPFSVCEPCHEKEYFEITNSLSMHTEMQTCTLCHTSHGKIPYCEICHRKHIKRHFDFNCKLCHGRETGLPPCQNCHGRTHEWSGFNTIINTS